jgi:hypothetical protein
MRRRASRMDRAEWGVGQVVGAVVGGVYEIVEDMENPRLSEEEKAVLSRAVYDALQQSVPFDEVWSSVALTCPEIAGRRTPEQLRVAHDNADCKVRAASCSRCCADESCRSGTTGIVRCLSFPEQ